MQSLWAAVTPYLIDLLATAIGIALSWAGVQFASTQSAIKEKTGLDIEALMRAALHQAMTTGAANATAGGLTGQAAISKVIDHAMLSVPDAIHRLGPSPAVLSNIAKAKLAQEQFLVSEVDYSRDT